MERSPGDQDHPETSGTTLPAGVTLPVLQTAIPGKTLQPDRDAEATAPTEKIPKKVVGKPLVDSDSETSSTDGDDRDDVDSLGTTDSALNEGAHPDVDALSTKGYLEEDPRLSSEDGLWTSADLGQRLIHSSRALDAFSESDTGEGKPLILLSKPARVPKEDLELEEALDAKEDDGLGLTGTTLVASDSTAKTPKIKDDKIWKELREKIMAEAKKMNFNPELSEDKQTIRVLDKTGNEAMCVKRNASNKTLTFSSKPPTSPEQLAGLLVGVKSCELKVAENSKVAAKLYEVLSEKGIKVKLHKNVIELLQENPSYKHIAEEYLQKNPSQAQPNASSARPTGGSKVVPPAAPTSEPSTKATNPVTPKDEAATVPPPATAAAEEPKKKKPGGP